MPGVLPASAARTSPAKAGPPPKAPVVKTPPMKVAASKAPAVVAPKLSPLITNAKPFQPLPKAQPVSAAVGKQMAADENKAATTAKLSNPQFNPSKPVINLPAVVSDIPKEI